MTTSKKELSAAFTAEELAAIKARGFSADTEETDEPWLVCEDGVMVSANAMRYNYELGRDAYAEDGVTEADFFADYGCRPVTSFYAASFDGEEWCYDEADTSLDVVLDMAEGREDEDVRIIRVFCPLFDMSDLHATIEQTKIIKQQITNMGVKITAIETVTPCGSIYAICAHDDLTDYTETRSATSAEMCEKVFADLAYSFTKRTSGRVSRKADFTTVIVEYSDGSLGTRTFEDAAEMMAFLDSLDRGMENRTVRSYACHDFSIDI